MKIVYKTEKNKILEKLGYYGIKDLPFLLIRFGKEKIRGYSGALSVEEINELDADIGIDLMGLYLFHDYGNEIRLSLDAVHIFQEQITKNILELDDKQAEAWFKGDDIPIPDEWKQENRGFKVLKNNNDLIGCGKLTNDRLVNYMPKERRIKSKK
jgi:NOL1/NOP2/fmu family ribosome biogenesis protein